MDTFEYLAVLVSIIVGLGVAHILLAVGRIISEPGQEKPYWIHVIWVLNAFLYLLYFWWFQLSYRSVEVWGAALYSFVVLYAVVLYLWCVILVPSSPKPDYREYFYARRRWIYGFLIAVSLTSAVDVFLTPESPAETFSWWGWCVWLLIAVVLPAVGMVSKRAAYHGFLAIFYMVAWLANLLFSAEPGL